MKKRIFVVALIALFFSFSLTAAFWPFDYFSATGNVVENMEIADTATCTDSDGGIIALASGVVQIEQKIG